MTPWNITTLGVHFFYFFNIFYLQLTVERGKFMKISAQESINMLKHFTKTFSCRPFHKKKLVEVSKKQTNQHRNTTSVQTKYCSI